MTETLPNFLIVGAAKSGTTTLAQHLRHHPDVFMAPGKEIHYFDDNFNKGLEWYQAHFSEATNQRAIGEATPMYMYLEEGPQRMAGVLPEARLLAILRNPVDRAYSHYWHERGRKREKLEFADAIAAERERLATGDHHSLHYYSYMDRGRYLRQLQRACQYYPREKVLVILFEDLCHAPLEVIQTACRFLEVDDSFVPPQIGKKFNRYSPCRSTKLRAIGRRVRPLKGLIDSVNDLNNSSYQPMSQADRAELVKAFKKDNDALAAWLGRDLSVWEK